MMRKVDALARLMPVVRSFGTAVLAMALLAACATPPASNAGRLALRLAPAALGATISLQQHLKVERNGKIDELDAALEVDPEHVAMVGIALGQRVLSLNYNGKELTSWRHVMLPAQVRAEDVLEDMQLSLWPADAVRAALPPGWRLEEYDLHRTLFDGDTPVTLIDYSGTPRWNGTVTMENLRYHYRLTVQSIAAGPAGP